MKFDFTKEEYEYIVEELMLNEEMQKILEYKIKDCSIQQMSDKLKISQSSLCRRIKKLKKMIMRVI